jgi:hypothetical protein
MQEFSSISVSTYEAGALADRLTDQSRDGWSVVAIVPTGSSVTAYLSRESDEPASSTVTPAATEPVVADETATEPTPDHAPDAETAPISESVSDPVAEAPGWAAGAAAEPATEPEASAPMPEAVSAPASQPEVAEATPAATTSGATAAAAAAPAGWYADPSSRFELRYWDGGQWTEHVSRAGQQYTDPPVA